MTRRSLLAWLAEPVRCPLWLWRVMAVAIPSTLLLVCLWSPWTFSLGLILLAIPGGILLARHMHHRHPKLMLREHKEQEAAEDDSANRYEALRRSFLLSSYPRWIFVLCGVMWASTGTATLAWLIL